MATKREEDDIPAELTFEVSDYTIMEVLEEVSFESRIPMDFDVQQEMQEAITAQLEKVQRELPINNGSRKRGAVRRLQTNDHMRPSRS